MTYIINSYRQIFYYQNSIDLKVVILLIVGAAGGCITGYMVFNKLQKGFAEQL